MEVTLEQLYANLDERILNSEYKIYKHTSPSGKVYIG